MQPAPTTEPPPRRLALRWLLAGALVAAVALFYLLGADEYFDWNHVRSRLDSWKQDVQYSLAVSVALFFLLYVGVAGLSLPVAWVLSVVSGALFGFWLGVAVVSVASTTGAALAFLSSRYVLRSWVREKFGDRLTRINQGIERDGPYYLFTLRLLPIFPFFLINLAMGVTSLRLWTFAWISWLGMLPGAALYVYAGTAVESIHSPRDIVSLQVLAALILLGLTPLLLRTVVRWYGRV